MHFVWHFLLVGILFAVIDSIWLAVVANKFYKTQLGNLLLEKPKFGPAVLFYIIAIIAMVIFVVNPALGAHSALYALAHGALLGLFGYSTYDLTNASTLRGWPTKIVFVDIIWGTVVTTGVSLLAYAILR